MNIKKLCTSGQIWTCAELHQLQKMRKRYEADEKFRKEVDSFWNQRHPVAVNIVR